MLKEPRSLQSINERMNFVIDLSESNITNRTGGPFGAAIFESGTGILIAVGVNLVVQTRCSLAHAEMVTILLAQQKLGTYDLGGPSLPIYELVTSSEPCAMCYGALPWSGVRRLICGARAEDAKNIGFNDGPKPEKWVEELENRKIKVIRDISRDRAVRALKRYKQLGGEIYNSRQGLAH